MFRILLACLFVLTIYRTPCTQNTVGLISNTENSSTDGYNLIYAHNQPNVYLLNNCGQIVHTWTDSISYIPGNSAYLLENGNLYKTKKPIQIDVPSFSAGGSGGTIELRDWENNLLWSTTVIDSLFRAHHDIAPLPNGNVLAIIWERKNINEVIDAGRDTSMFNDTELWPDMIVEFDPFKDSIVWEWHAWDHLIQEFDSLKSNFGAVANHPELININFNLNGLGGRNDWMHTNSIDYNSELDQILLSIPFFNEVWIIDHSTSTTEAAGHTEGNSGKGGDLLFRWGNPRAYQQGDFEDQKLFFQHDAHWIDDFVSTDSENFGQIALFNNRIGSNYSSVSIVAPELDNTGYNYAMSQNEFLPFDYEVNLTHPDSNRVFSGGLSSMQVLDSGNFFICSGRQGYVFEMTPQQEILWEYILPLNGGDPVSQGEAVLPGTNNLFRAKKYPIDFSAFDNKDLSPQGYIELNPSEEFCNLIDGVTQLDIGSKISISPNPSVGLVKVKSQDEIITKVDIYNSQGQIVLSKIIKSRNEELDLRTFENGLYYFIINDSNSSKIIIQN